MDDTAELLALAEARLETLLSDAPPSTLDEVLRRLFDGEARELTYSAFGSSL